MRTIEVLRDALSSYTASRPHGLTHPVQSASFDPIDGLLQLGESMIEHETVPVLDETASRAQQVDIHDNGSRHPEVPEFRTQSSKDSTIIIPEAPIQSTGNYSGDPFTTFLHQLSRVRPPTPIHLTPRTIRTAESHSTERSEVSNASNWSLDSCQEGESISGNLKQHDNGDDNNYMSVEPLPHIIHISQPESRSRVDGYIIDGRRFRFVTAVLWKNVEKNLISQAYAARCGLPVTFLEGDGGEDILIEFWYGSRIQCVGETIVRWSPDQTIKKPFTTRCLVCDLGERAPDIIFGNPFITKRAHYEKVGSG